MPSLLTLFSSMQAAKRAGWVTSVNAARRTATVAWADGSAASEHSVYQLQVRSTSTSSLQIKRTI